MILLVIIIGLIIIFWLQMPFIKDDNSTPEAKYKTIFNKIKIPIVFICLVALVYLLLNKTVKLKSTDNLKNLEIDFSGFGQF